MRDAHVSTRASPPPLAAICRVHKLVESLLITAFTMRTALWTVALLAVFGVATVAVSVALFITCRKLRAASAPRRDSRLLAESDDTAVEAGVSGGATLAPRSYAAAAQGGGIAKDSVAARA